MIEFIDIDYHKEYKELVEAFIPDKKDKGFKIEFKKIGEFLNLNIENYQDKIQIDDYFEIEKSNIKRGIYKLLSKYTNRKLQWGILVGVNPLKLFRNLEEKYTREKAIEIFKEGYFLSSKKIDLGFKIIDNQNNLKDISKRGYSLYIDVPFCPTKCKYCSYPTYCIDDKKMDKYIEVLIKEIKSISSEIKESPQFIYIGGGTPSAIGVDRLDRVITEVKESFGDVEEFTVEIGRPDTITNEILKMLKGHNIHRISINPQSMKESTLEILGRDHTVNDIISSFKLAREVGFNNINMDLIIGLPKESPEDFYKTLEEIKKLNCESLSIHALALKKGSSLTEEGYKSDSSLEFEKIRDEFTKKNNYYPYYLYRQKHMYLNMENIGYSKKGFESKYNIAMMDDIHTIIGLGLGSTTKIITKNKIIRHMNYRKLEDYFEKAEENIKEKLELLREYRSED